MPQFHPTPAMMEAAYEFFKIMPPFNRWKLPALEGLRFYVSRDSTTYGDCNLFNTPTKTRLKYPLIRVSYLNCKTLEQFMSVMAHEICHLHTLSIDGRANHGPRWKEAADLVCKYHGFNPATF